MRAHPVRRLLVDSVDGIPFVGFLLEARSEGVVGATTHLSLVVAILDDAGARREAVALERCRGDTCLRHGSTESVSLGLSRGAFLGREEGGGDLSKTEVFHRGCEEHLPRDFICRGEANKKGGCRNLFGEDYTQLFEFAMNGQHLGNVVGHSRAILKADLEHYGDENGNSYYHLVHEAILEILPNGIGGGIVVESVDKFGRGGADEDANDSHIGLLPLAVLGNRILILLGCHNIGGIGRLLGHGGLLSLAMIEKNVLEVNSTYFTTQEVLVNPIAPCLEVGASAVGFKAEQGDGVGESGWGEGHDEEPFRSRAKRRS
ncbi:unnamed protein product [Closterium sp. NIES-54]